MEATQGLLSLKETAKALGVSVPTVRRMVDRGDLERIEISKRVVRIDPAKVAALIESGRGRRTRPAVGAR